MEKRRTYLRDGAGPVGRMDKMMHQVFNLLGNISPPKVCLCNHSLGRVYVFISSDDDLDG